MPRPRFSSIAAFLHDLISVLSRLAFASTRASIPFTDEIEKDELEVRIAKQKRIVAALTELADVGEDSGPPEGLVKGITDACKTAVLGANKALYPPEVRDRIKALGFPEQQNLLASVHTVLKRLAEAGEIKLTDDGAYRRMTLGERIGHAPTPGDYKRELKSLLDPTVLPEGLGAKGGSVRLSELVKRSGKK